ncbi:MAG: SpoVR family protein [Candidatus Melainabacteria bacterium]|nr:MAG: SpoVR family protein [Candidatus Melainabacteria bacterium]
MSTDKLITNIRMWDERLTRAAIRRGRRPFPTRYELVSDAAMVRLVPYVMMPTHYRHWSYGKRYEEFAGQGTFKILEAVINSNPSFCYLGITNPFPVQLRVMTHAKFGHVDFFANNQSFSESGANSIIPRLAQNANFIKRLSDDPTYGVERVEFILDAAHALDDHIGLVPSIKEVVSEKEARQKLEHLFVEKTRELVAVQHSQFEQKQVQDQIDKVKAMLLRDPLRPTTDILGFIMDPANNPRLGNEERGLIAIVRDQARYMKPQGPTKIMNEGWAMKTEKDVLLAPEVGLPYNWAIEYARQWTHHKNKASNLYFDPYAFGEDLFNYIDAKHGFDDGEVEVETPEFTTRDVRPEDLEGDTPEYLCKTIDGKVMEWTGTYKKVTIPNRNDDKVLSVRANRIDKSFIREFLTKEFVEGQNEKALEWLHRVAGIISRFLLKNRYPPQVAFHPIEETLTNASTEKMMQIIGVWMKYAQESEELQKSGWPAFPVPPETLKEMATILQIVAAFDKDHKLFRTQMILRTAGSMKPDLVVFDGGPHSKDPTGTLTIVHVYDPTFGLLLQSECRDTVLYLGRLWAAPVKLITVEQPQNRWGEDEGQPKPFFYHVDAQGKLTEGYIPEEEKKK